MWCWKDGQYVKDTDLRISPFDHGFLYGIGFFETFRTYNGEPFLFDEHFQRLQQALDEYNIHLSYSKEQLVEIIHELTTRNDGRDGYFRLNISAGNEGLGLQARAYNNPTVILFRKELVDGPLEKKAVLLKTVRNSPEQALRYKSHHYANNVLARQELDSLLHTEGFFVNEYGYIAEGITSNIFWVKNEKLFTPSINLGILNGITRQFVMKLAKELGIEVVEGEFLLEELLSADECFVTTSIQELIPIIQFEDKVFPGLSGAVYKRLHNSYRVNRGDGL